MRPTVGIAAVASLGAVRGRGREPGRSARSLSPPAATTAADATARIVASAPGASGHAGRGRPRSKVQFPFDSPQKSRWSNLPTGIFQREGLRLGDLTPAQRTAAMALLSTARSVRTATGRSSRSCTATKSFGTERGWRRADG